MLHRLVLFALAVALGACRAQHPKDASPSLVPPVRAEPGALVFHPDTPEIEVSLVNRSTQPVLVSGVQIAGPSWSSFSIVEPLDPRVVLPGRPMRFTVVADAASVETDRAELRFRANGVEQRTPIRLEDSSWISSTLVPGLTKVVLLIAGFVLPLAASLRGNSPRAGGQSRILADVIKLLCKENVIPGGAHRTMFALAPVLALAMAVAGFAILPFGDALCMGQLLSVVSQADVDQCAAGRGGTPLQVARLSAGLLFTGALASLRPFGTVLAGWASGEDRTLHAARRAAIEAMLDAAAISLALAGPVLVYGTLEPHRLVRAQLHTSWGILLQPAACLLVLAISALRDPHSEAVGSCAYSGIRLGLLVLSERIHTVFVAALVTTVFLGGWSLPLGMLGAAGFVANWVAVLALATLGAGLLAASVFGPRAWAVVGAFHLAAAIWAGITGGATQLPHILVVIVGGTVWMVKVYAVCRVQLLVRRGLPRFRGDDIIRLSLKVLLPLSLASTLFTALAVYAVSAFQASPPEPNPARLAP